MQIPETRVITQFLVGLMLLFGGVTLVPKAIILFRKKNVPRALLYTCLGGVSFFLALVSFLMAFDKV